MNPVKQAAVDRLVAYLAELGYTQLEAVDLALVTQAVAQFRSSKAAARFVCGVLGGRGNCLTPLQSLDVRRTLNSRQPASRIPSPEEIQLQARFAARSLKLPRIPATAASRGRAGSGTARKARQRPDAMPAPVQQPTADWKEAVTQSGLRGNFTVLLAAEPNEDFEGSTDADGQHRATVRIPQRTFAIPSLGGARSLLRAFVTGNNLGSGNIPPAAGRVRLEGEPFAHVSFNGRIFQADSRWKLGQELDEFGKPIASTRSASAESSSPRQAASASVATTLSPDEERILREDLVNSEGLLRTEQRLQAARQKAAEADLSERVKLGREKEVARLNANLKQQLAERKELNSALQRLAQKRKTTVEQVRRLYPMRGCEPCQPSADEIANRLNAVNASLTRTEAKLAPAAEAAREKRVKPSARKRAAERAERLNEQAGELYLQKAELEKQLEDAAAQAGVDPTEIVVDRSAKQRERDDRKLAKESAKKMERQLSDAKAAVQAAEAKAQKSEATPPKQPVDDGTALVNRLAAKLLSNKR